LKRIKPLIMGAILLFSFNLFPFQARADANPLPGPPRNLVLINVTEVSVRFGWEHPDPGDTGIKYYNVYKDGQYLGNTVISTTNHNVTGLSPGTAYAFKVSAVNEAGEGPFSNGITVTTKSESSSSGNAEGNITYPDQGQRLNALGQITGTASDSDGTVLAVDLYITDGQGRYLRPDLSAFEEAEEPSGYYLPVRNTGANYSTWELELESLSAFQDGEYTIRVCPYDGMYNTDGQEVSFILDTTPPQVPLGLAVEDISSTGVKLVWEPPDSQDTEGYHVYVNHELYAETTLTCLDITGLTPGSVHFFYITAHDGLNHSQPCDMLQVSTPQDPSSKPPSKKRPAPLPVKQESPVIRHEDGNIIVDTTNYFPGKQISSKTVMLEEELVRQAVNGGSDIIITGGFGSLCLKTSLCRECTGGGPIQLTIEGEGSHPALLEFTASRPGFELIADILTLDFSGLPASIPVFAYAPLTAEGIGEAGRPGYICPENGRIYCRYRGVEFTSGGVMFPVYRPGIYGIVAYDSPYSGFRGHWAEHEMDRVLAAGILVPEDFTLSPDSSITRCLFQSMLSKSTGTGGDAADNCGGQLLTRAALAEMAAGALGVTADFDTAVDMGLIIGYEDGNVCPERNATLAEAAAVLCRLTEQLSNKPDAYLTE